MLAKRRFTRILVLIIAFTLAFSAVAYGENKPLKVNQDDLIYFIMTDRFYDADKSNNQDVAVDDLGSFHGGDLQGVIEKLDYIKDLGFTTIWITPVVKNQNGGYHGYWAVDFYKTDEHLGTIEKFKELVNTAHAKGIKVVLDIVVNHVSSMHPFVGEPKYEKWFHDKGNISNYNDQTEVEEGKIAALPDFNQDNPEVSKYLIDMAKWWIKETNIDGFRLDTVKHVPKRFWTEFTREIKKDYPDFYMIGEVWNGDMNYVADYQNTGIDGLVDFPMYYALTDVFKNYAPTSRLAEMIENSNKYSNKYLNGTFIDNHDVERFVNQVYKEKDEKLQQAITFMMTYTGIPVMYYGTEIGLEGGADPDNRRDMDWSAKSPTTELVKKLAAIRKANKALTRGDIKILKSEKDFIAYSRKFEDNTIIVTYNTSSLQKNAQFDIPKEDVEKQSLLTDLIGKEGAKDVKIEDGKVSLSMAPSQVNVFTYKQSSGIDSNVVVVIAGGASAATLLIVVVVLLRKRKR
ncbi:MAG: alpha-amylase family glycosyl hydrolase [Clostridia bacterium]|nr:alpha-amylase family glycosyl hydrolase [Clostridia bacterium]